MSSFITPACREGRHDECRSSVCECHHHARTQDNTPDNPFEMIAGMAESMGDMTSMMEALAPMIHTMRDAYKTVMIAVLTEELTLAGESEINRISDKILDRLFPTI